MKSPATQAESGSAMAPRVLPGDSVNFGAMSPTFQFQEILDAGHHHGTPYKQLTSDFVGSFEANGKRFLEVAPEALTLLTRTAMRDIAHLLRPGHLAQLRAILDDADASANDRFVIVNKLDSCLFIPQPDAAQKVGKWGVGRPGARRMIAATSGNGGYLVPILVPWHFVTQLLQARRRRFSDRERTTDGPAKRIPAIFCAFRQRPAM